MTNYTIRGDCVICGERGEEVRLCGDYQTALCHKHRNEWKEYAHPLKEINDYMRKVGTVDLFNKRLAGGINVPEDYYLDCQRAAKDASYLAFLMAKRWVEQRKKYHDTFKGGKD